MGRVGVSRCSEDFLAVEISFWRLILTRVSQNSRKGGISTPITLAILRSEWRNYPRWELGYWEEVRG